MDSLVVLFWALIGSVVSLIGGIALMKASKKRANFVKYAMPFGAGSMLAAAFLGLFPEAVEGSDVHQAVYWALGGFLAFFVLERLLGWFHHHHHDHHAHGAKDKAHTSLVIIGDTLHNAIDGVVLGAAFLVSPAAGIGAAIAIAAHEIHQEIGDFGILLGKGMKAKKALLVNVMSALATVATAMTTYWIGNTVNINAAPLLALAAGFFIYVAAADIIPDIHEKPHAEGRVQAFILILGIAVIGAVLAATPHSHEPTAKANSQGDGLHEGPHDHDHTH